MRQSRLGAGGENVLQTIRAKRAEAQGRGVRLIDLSIGEPKGPALLSARQAAAAAVMSDDEAMHAYQYNASPGVPDFAPRFIKAHVQRALPQRCRGLPAYSRHQTHPGPGSLGLRLRRTARHRRNDDQPWLPYSGRLVRLSSACDA